VNRRRIQRRQVLAATCRRQKGEEAVNRRRIQRRQVLAATARTAAGLTLAAYCPAFARQRRGPRRPRGFRLGVCDWTIDKRTDPAAFEIAKKIGLDGVQVDFGSGENDLPLFDEDTHPAVR